nr:Ig-like domain-containing protein [Granulicella sibirica]
MAGTTMQLHAIDTSFSKQTSDVTGTATWTSSSPAVATVSSTGLLTGVASGSVTITAVVSSDKGTFGVSVGAATVTALTVSPQNAALSAGQTQAYTASASYTDKTTGAPSGATWSVSPTSVATINATTGLLTAVANGSYNVTCVAGGQTATAPGTVNTALPSSIAITPVTASVAGGKTQQFTATGRYADGSMIDLSGSVTWSSSNPSLLTITSTGLATAAAVTTSGTVTLTATLGSITSNVPVQVTPAATVTSLYVNPTSSSIAQGSAEQHTATAIYSDGSQQDVSSLVTWGVSGTVNATSNVAGGLGAHGRSVRGAVDSDSVASVDQAGIDQALSPGTTQVTASMGPVQSASVVIVTPATISSLGIQSSDALFPIGSKQQVMLIGKFSDGTTQDLSLSGNWQSSDPSVATIDSGTGWALGIAAGAVHFTASFGGLTAISPVFQVLPPTLISTIIDMDDAAAVVGIPQHARLIGNYSDGTIQDLTTLATWVSDDPSVFYVSSTGAAQALSLGSTQISATVFGKTAVRSVSGVPLTLNSIIVLPANFSFALGTTMDFIAIGNFSSGVQGDISPVVVWTSSDPAVLTIDGNGRAKSGKLGTTTVTATLLGISQVSVPVTVSAATLQTLAISPSTAQIAAQTAQQYTVTGFFSDGTIQDLSPDAIYSISDPTVATADNDGTVTGLKAGAVQVSASIFGQTVTAPLTSTNATLSSVSVTPADSELPVGVNLAMKLMGTFSDGTTQDLSADAVWSTPTPSIVNVILNGQVAGVSPGAGFVQAQRGLFSGATNITVTNARVSSLVLTPASNTIRKLQNKAITLLGTFSDGHVQDLTVFNGFFSVDNPQVAAVIGVPPIYGVGVGTATVTAAFQGLAASSTFRVESNVVTSQGVTPANPTITAGTTQKFSDIITYDDGTTDDVSSSTTWTSSNPAVLSIDSTGLATAQSVSSALTVTITGVSGATTSAATVTVQPAAVPPTGPTLTQISVSPTSSQIAFGTPVQLTAFGTYSDGSLQNLSATATWTTSNATLATVSSTGLVTGKAAGLVSVQAQVGGVQATAFVQVTNATLTSVAISSSGANLAIGSPQQFTLTGTFSDGSMQNLSAFAAWTSSAPAVATISNTGLATGVSTGSVQFTGSYGGKTATTTPVQVSSAALVSVALTPSNPTFARGTQQQFKLTGTYSDSTTRDLTENATFVSSNPAVVVVSGSGLATGVAPGNVRITASASGLAATTQSVTVTAATLASIAITPNSPSFANGTTLQFTATGTFSDGSTQDLSTQTLWTSNNPQVLTIDTNGLATARGVGSAQVTATFNGVTGTTGAVTVTSTTLTNLTISPTTVQIAKGTTQQFTATGTFADGTRQNLSTSVTWTSSNGGVVMINAAGLATGTGVGSAQVTASYQGMSASTTAFLVTPATLVSVAFSPANPTVAVGSTTQVTVTGTFSDGSTQDLSSISAYSSSNPTAVTVSPTGLISGVSSGTSTITVQVDGVTSTFTATARVVTLVSVAIAPSSPAAFAKGTTQQFAATGTFSDGSTQTLSTGVVWISSDPTVFTVDMNGLATATGVGSAHLTATYQGQTATTSTFQVTPAAVASIAITPPSPSLTAGGTQQFTATATYTDGTTQDISNTVSWSSSNAALLSIDSSGLATAHTTATIATATITAQLGSTVSTDTVTVQPIGSGNPTLNSIVVKPTSSHVATGTTEQLTAIGTYSDGSSKDLSATVTWTSANTANATVSSTGLVTGLLPALVDIEAQMGTVQYSGVVHVTAAVLTSVAISPSGASFAAGVTQQFTLKGTFSDGSTQDLSSSATWSSSASGVAFISSTGLAVGVAPGAVQFTATYMGQSATTAAVQVTPASLTSISIVPGSPSFAAGTSQQFEVIGTFSDGSTHDLTDLATFASSNVSILDVSASGVARGVAPGSSQITATVDGQSVTTPSVTVTPATLVSIAITPASPSLANGTTAQFTAIATFSDGTTQDVTTQATWTSSNPQILTIDQNGLADSDGTGSGSVSAMLNGVTATSGTVSITAATLTSLAISPANAQVAKGTTRQFTATGTFSDGSTQNLSTNVAWTSSNGAIVAINANGLATGEGTGAAQLTASYQGQTASTSSFTVTPATLVSIAFSPATPSVAAGTTAQVTTTGNFSDGSTQDLSGSATYSSSDPTVATVSATGLVSGVAPGTSVVTVTAGGMTSTFTVNVTTATLVSIAITPGTPASFAKGTTQQFTATGTYSDGTTQNLSSSATWTTSNASAITVDSHGLATGAGVGSAQLTATYQGRSATTPSVSVTPAVVASISVSPRNPSITSIASQQFTATATYTDGTTADVTGTSTWSSSNTTVATVNASGLAQALAPGTTTIQAVSGSFSSSTVLTVTLVFAPTLLSVAVTPANGSVAATTNLQFHATGTYSDTSTADVTGSVTWSSSTPAAATINAAGLATGIAVGTTTIQATSGLISGSTGLTVTTAPVTLVSLAITPASASIAKGTAQQFTATGTYSDASTQNLTTQVTWSSSAGSVASINSSGSAMGTGAGNTQITATYLGQSTMVTLTVSPATLVSLAVTPASVSVAAGTGQQYRAVGTLSDGSTQDLTTSVTWSSSNTAAATISASGLASTTSVGSSTIMAQSGTVSNTAALNVTAATVVSVQLTPSSVSLAAGGVQQLMATATFTDGSSQDVTTSATYSTSNAGVATVDVNGKLTAAGAGMATITATLGSASATLTATISNAVLTSIAITPSPVSLAAGTSQQLTATGTFSDGSTEDLTNTATWSSSAPATASVSSTGNVIQAQAGNATITAASGGANGTVMVTGTSAVVTSISVSPVSVTLAAGQTQQFAATATLSDSTQQTITASAHWSVSNPAKATVGDSGASKGFLTSSAAGTITVQATSGGVTGSATVTIQPAQLSSLTIRPESISLPAGTTQALTVTGVYTDGSTANLTVSTTFTSASPSTAAVSGSGVVQGVSAGSTTVTATVQGVSAAVPVTVTAAVLSSIAITPAAPSLALGLHTQLTATGTYTDGSTANISSQVQWTSSAPSVATISSTGLLTSVATGSSTVAAALNGISQSVPATVTAAALQSIAVLPVGTSIPLGLSQQMQAIGTYTDGTTQDITSMVTWSSQTPAVGVVSSTGVATGVTTGSFLAKATKGAVTGSVSVTITSAVLQSIVVTPANQPVVNLLQNSVQYTATGQYSDGSMQNITNSVHWAITGIVVGSITQTGTFSPIGVGLGTVTATSGAISGSTNVLVVSVL